jgi:serine/threonine protein phosphatase 1
VLEKAGHADRVIFLGDYVDGLPESYEVVEHIANMPNAIMVRGNHDQWALEWLDDGRAMLCDYKGEPSPPVRHHYTQGGRATYESYKNRSPEERDTHCLILKNTKPHFIDEQNRVYVHGGFDNSGVEGLPIETKMWDRDLMQTAYARHMYITRKHPDAVIDPSRFPAPFNMYPEIYVGHTATKFFTDKEEPANWLNLWAMDTNCGWGGPLVAMDVDTKEMFYSRPAREHYPDFKGR